MNKLKKAINEAIPLTLKTDPKVFFDYHMKRVEDALKKLSKSSQNWKKEFKAKPTWRTATDELPTAASALENIVQYFK